MYLPFKLYCWWYRAILIDFTGPSQKHGRLRLAQPRRADSNKHTCGRGRRLLLAEAQHDAHLRAEPVVQQHARGQHGQYRAVSGGDGRD